MFKIEKDVASYKYISENHTVDFFLCKISPNKNNLLSYCSFTQLCCLVLYKSKQAVFCFYSIIIILTLLHSFSFQSDVSCCFFLLSLSACLCQAEDTVVVVPYKSRHVRLVLKGPDHLCKSW